MKTPTCYLLGWQLTINHTYSGNTWLPRCALQANYMWCGVCLPPLARLARCWLAAVGWLLRHYSAAAAVAASRTSKQAVLLRSPIIHPSRAAHQ